MQNLIVQSGCSSMSGATGPRKFQPNLASSSFTANGGVLLIICNRFNTCRVGGLFCHRTQAIDLMETDWRAYLLLIMIHDCYSTIADRRKYPGLLQRFLMCCLVFVFCFAGAP